MKNIDELLAKSKENGSINLIEHSKSVTNLSMYIYDTLFVDANINNPDYQFGKDVAIAASMHDIGKCYSKFQSWVSKKKNCKMSEDNLEPDKNVCHNLLSWAYLMQNIKMPKSSDKEAILSGVLNHHVVYKEHQNYDTNKLIDIIENDTNYPYFNEFFDIMSNYVFEAFGIKIIKDGQNEDRSVGEVHTHYNMTRVRMDDFECNSAFQIVRSILIFADRMVSGHPELIEGFLANNKDVMQQLLDKVSTVETNSCVTINKEKYDNNRLGKQISLLNEINSYNNNIVGANAGYGKTLIGLQWIIENKKKALWVMPRNVIVRGTYESIVNELSNFNNGNKLSVALLIGGVYEYGDENSDIIVTNIDNFLSPMVKNGEAHHLLNLMTSNVVFDEYHEFLGEEPLFAAFISTVYTRTHYTDSKTLLLSASPLRFDLKYWNLSEQDKPVHFINPEPFNGEMNVNISYKEIENAEDINPDKDDTFIMCNTIKQAQNNFVLNKNGSSTLLHSLFTKADRERIESDIYITHGKNGNVNERKTVVGTNIIGVGLDISAKNVYDFVITPEDTIQRVCGRGGRFAEKEYDNEINAYMCDVKGDAGNSRLINNVYSMSLQKKWISTLKEYDGKTITKTQLYNVYYAFCGDNKKEIEKLWDDFFQKSCSQLIKLKPYSNRKKKVNESLVLGSGSGFRGDNNSIYVIAQKVNNTEYSEPIILSSDFVSENVLPGEYCEDAKKKRYNLLRENESLKYLIKNKDWHNIGDIPLILAKHQETPFVLTTIKYDNNVGLMLHDYCE